MSSLHKFVFEISDINQLKAILILIFLYHTFPIGPSLSILGASLERVKIIWYFILSCAQIHGQMWLYIVLYLSVLGNFMKPLLFFFRSEATSSPSLSWVVLICLFLPLRCSSFLICVSYLSWCFKRKRKEKNNPLQYLHSVSTFHWGANVWSLKMYNMIVLLSIIDGRFGSTAQGNYSNCNSTVCHPSMHGSRFIVFRPLFYSNTNTHVFTHTHNKQTNKQTNKHTHTHTHTLKSLISISIHYPIMGIHLIYMQVEVHKVSWYLYILNKYYIHNEHIYCTQNCFKILRLCISWVRKQCEDHIPQIIKLFCNVMIFLLPFINRIPLSLLKKGAIDTQRNMVLSLFIKRLQPYRPKPN